MNDGRGQTCHHPAPGALALLGLVAVVLHLLAARVLPRVLACRCPVLAAAALDVQRRMAVLAVIAWREAEADPGAPASWRSEEATLDMLDAVRRLAAAMARARRPVLGVRAPRVAQREGIVLAPPPAPALPLAAARARDGPAP